MTDLGPVGVYVPGTMTDPPSSGEQRAAARRFEDAGYGTIWVNETVGGKDPLVQLALLLGITQRVVAGTGIANIWARAPQVAHGGAALLADAFPGRVVLGLGVGYPQQAEMAGREYGSPIAAMSGYLDRMHAPTMPPAPDAAYPRIVAANGPKMLALAAGKADGALPAGLPPEFTAAARKALGPDKLLVVGMNLVLDNDRERARASARQVVQFGLRRPAAVATLVGLGYSEAEVADVADRLVDAAVAHPDADAVAELIRRHRAAGADHVVLLPSLSSARPPTVDQLVALAPALV